MDDADDEGQPRLVHGPRMRKATPKPVRPTSPLAPMNEMGADQTQIYQGPPPSNTQYSSALQLLRQLQRIAGEARQSAAAEGTPAQVERLDRAVDSIVQELEAFSPGEYLRRLPGLTSVSANNLGTRFEFCRTSVGELARLLYRTHGDPDWESKNRFALVWPGQPGGSPIYSTADPATTCDGSASVWGTGEGQTLDLRLSRLGSERFTIPLRAVRTPDNR